MLFSSHVTNPNHMYVHVCTLNCSVLDSALSATYSTTFQPCYYLDCILIELRVNNSLRVPHRLLNVPRRLPCVPRRLPCVPRRLFSVPRRLLEIPKQLDYLPDLLVAIRCFKHFKHKMKSSTRFNAAYL